MTFMRGGTGPGSCRYLGMNKLDTSRTMRQLADKMRQHARETALPEYQSMMRRAANTLEAEAELISERQFQEFSRTLQVFSDSQFSTRYH
jgi:hypothetical protein